MMRATTTRAWHALAAGLGLALFAGAAKAVTQIHVLSNRADLISGGDALIELVPAPPPGTLITAGAANVTSRFALRPNGRYMGLLSGLAVGTTTLRVTLPDLSGAAIAITNHPPEGPLFSGPHLQPWDCSTEAEGLGAPKDAHCNVDPVVEYLYVPTGGSGYQPYDPGNPPTDVANTTTDQGHTVRHIVRHEIGAINRGIYAFAVLHDPGVSPDPIPWDPQPGWNGKLYYTFGGGITTSHRQGPTPNVLSARLAKGFAVATTSLNVFGNHSNSIIAAESALMTKERVIETLGEIRYTIGTGGSGGSVQQLQIGSMYPGIINGLIPSEVFPDEWTAGLALPDCVALEKYWPQAAIPFTPLQREAVDGHGPPYTSCKAFTALIGIGNPSSGCFHGLPLPPPVPVPDPGGRDYYPILNPDGCRSTLQDVQVNRFGRRARDHFAKRPVDNVGVQYGLRALNLPLGDPGKITFVQFLDMNSRIGGFDINGLPQTARTRADPGVSRNAYRSSAFNDGAGLGTAAIISLPAAQNVDFHNPYHAYGTQDRIIESIGHADNYAIWHHGPEDLAFDTMDEWLSRVEADPSSDPLAVKIVNNRPATAFDSCWSGEIQGPLSDCAGEVYGDPRIAAGMPRKHDVLQCKLRPINPADYAGAIPAPTALELAQLQTIFPEGVCDYTKPAVDKVPSVRWPSFQNGPGGEPLGPEPVSLPF